MKRHPVDPLTIVRIGEPVQHLARQAGAVSDAELSHPAVGHDLVDHFARPCSRPSRATTQKRTANIDSGSNDIVRPALAPPERARNVILPRRTISRRHGVCGPMPLPISYRSVPLFSATE